MPRTSVRMGAIGPSVPVPQDEGVPLLPGNNFHDDPIMKYGRHKKVTTCDTRHGAPCMVSTISPTFDPPIYGKIDAAEEPDRTSTPPWLTQHNVLRFNAYFLEPIVESDIETVRVRKCCIYFHTEDNTILVREAAAQNSGMAQGVLIKRHCIPVDPSELAGAAPRMLAIEDLNIGREVTLYGKCFRIISVDSNTRNHLTSVLGYEVPEDQDWPAGNQFEAHQEKRVRRNQMTKELMDMKRHHEYGCTGQVSMPSPRKVKAAQQFYTQGGKQLMFMAAWDDRNSPHGDLRLLQITYYLEDDTIQVMEPPTTNSGREGQSKLVTRQRVPNIAVNRNGAFTNESLLDHLQNDAKQHLTFGVSLDQNYLAEDDFQIGKILNIHEKKILIYDADSITREHYRNKGTPLGPPVDIKDYFNIHPYKVPRVRPVPHDGIGTEEDSLGSWKNLLLKPPKRDHEKETKYGGKILNYALRMVPSANAVVEEEGRHFVLSFWLENDTMQICEIGINNSGLMGGKYLARQRVKRMLPDGSSKWFTPEDFQVGEVITILSKQFRVLEMDGATEKLLGGIVDPSTPEDIKRLIVLLRESMLLKHPRVQEAFRAVGGHMNNNIDVEDLIAFYRTVNYDCKREDAKTIISMFNTRGTGTLDFNEFVAMVQGDEHSLKLDELANSTRAFKLSGADMFTQTAANTDDTIQRAQKFSVYSKKCQNLLTLLRDKIAQKRIASVEVFRVLNGCSLDSLLYPAEFHKGLQDLLQMTIPPPEAALLESVFFPDGQPCPLQRFSTILEGTENYI